MITGSCPYCDKHHMWIEPETAYGRFVHVTCDDEEGCKKTYWIYVTRGWPYALTEEDFAEKYVVNEANKSIAERNPPPPLTEEQEWFRSFISRVAAETVAKEIIGEMPLQGPKTQTDLLRKRYGDKDV